MTKALANHFRGPGSIPSMGCRRVNQTEKYSLPCLMLLYSCKPHNRPTLTFNFIITLIIQGTDSFHKTEGQSAGAQPNSKICQTKLLSNDTSINTTQG